MSDTNAAPSSERRSQDESCSARLFVKSYTMVKSRKEPSMLGSTTHRYNVYHVKVKDQSSTKSDYTEGLKAELKVAVDSALHVPQKNRNAYAYDSKGFENFVADKTKATAESFKSSHPGVTVTSETKSVGRLRAHFL